MAATRSSKAAPARPLTDFFSHPSEEELIDAHLRSRVSDGKPCTFIHHADVYSVGPAELTNDFAPALASNGDRAWYFFSAVRTKSREGQRKARTVDSGEGCWHSEAGAKPVVVEPRRRLGHRQSFSFVTKVDGRRVRSGWLMVELGLDGTDDMVLCKMYFSPRAHLLTGGAAAWRKRKAAAGGGDKNPAPVRQRRLTRPTTDAAGAEPKDDTQTQCSELVDEKSVSDDDAAGSVLLQLGMMQEREEFLAQGYYVDRPDEEIRAELGFQEIFALLDDGAAKNCEELLEFPSYDNFSRL